MDFLYLFDLVDFDAKGNVVGTKTVEISKARSNFLYLVSKYNQFFLKEEKLPVPEFFKEKLSAVLADVEACGDYAAARKTVIAACLPKVQLYAKKSDKDLILALGNLVILKDKEFADTFQTAKNNLQLEYIITHISGLKYESILRLLKNDLSKEDKSKLFRSIIQYNSLINTAQRVREDQTFDVGSLIG